MGTSKKRKDRNMYGTMEDQMQKMPVPKALKDKYKKLKAKKRTERRAKSKGKKGKKYGS